MKVQTGSLGRPSHWALEGADSQRLVVPGTPGSALQGCTQGWGAPGSLIKTLGHFRPLPHVRQPQRLEVLTGAFLTDATLLHSYIECQGM